MKSVKQYYFTEIWPRLAPRALTVDEAEEEALRQFPDDSRIREDFRGLRCRNAPRGRIWLYEEAAGEVLKWFSTGANVRGFNIVVDVEEEFIAGRVYVGEFPTGDVNATICQIPEVNGFLVLFNSGIVEFLTDIINISTRWVGIDTVRYSLLDELQEEAVTTKPLISRSEAVRQISEIVQRYIEQDAYFSFRRTVLEQRELAASAANISFSVLKFILAHELAHCALGHLNAPSGRTRRLSHAGLALNVILQTHEQELQADWLGANLPLLKIPLPQRFDPRKFYLTPEWGVSVLETVTGAILFFSLLELLGDGQGGDGSSITHPAVSTRKNNIKAIYDLILDQRWFRIADLYSSLFADVRSSR